MHLRKVIISNLHGIFNHNVSFHEDFTFIHGINGTGKTSLLNAIQALLLPDLRWLTLNNFKKLSIELLHNDTVHKFECTKTSKVMVLKAKQGSNAWQAEEYSLEKINFAVTTSKRRGIIHSSEQETRYLDNAIMNLFSDSEIVREIQTIPTPIFLGLSRTANQYSEEDSYAYERRKKYPSQVEYNNTTIDDGLNQALTLVRRAAHKFSSKKRRLEEKLKKDITFLLFSVSEIGGKLELPKKNDIQKFQKMHDEITETLSKIGYDIDDISKNITPLFKEIDEAAKKLHHFKNIDEAFQHFSDKEIESNLVFNWFDKKPIIGLLNKYFELIEKFNSEEQTIRIEVERYENIINNFFQDSMKSISVMDNGEVHISKDGKKFDLEKMSSGEKHIFILLSQLIFNPFLHRTNVLVIDEPEVSLHVRWQEIFVTSVRKANQFTQLVLATHSPSIVMDKSSNMVDLDVT